MPNGDARQQARAQLSRIMELVSALREAQGNGHRDEQAYQAAAYAIRESLSKPLRVRSGWYIPHAAVVRDRRPIEFILVLRFDVVVMGELGDDSQPEAARVEYQTEGGEWQELEDVSTPQKEALLEYCRQFYLGE